MENGNRRAMLKSRAKLAITAMARETALIAVSLSSQVLAVLHSQFCAAWLYHLGSGTNSPLASVVPGGIDTLQLCTRAIMLKALAIGPKVPC